MNNEDQTIFIENIIKKELENYKSSIDSANQHYLLIITPKEIEKNLLDEDIVDKSIKAKQNIIKNTIKWLLNKALKIFKSDLPIEYYDFIFELLIETLVKVINICIESGFEKEESLSIIKGETETAMLLAITVLKDEDKLDQELFNIISTQFK